MEHSGAETPRIADKVFTFQENKKNTQESISVSIPEVCLKRCLSLIITPMSSSNELAVVVFIVPSAAAETRVNQ